MTEKTIETLRHEMMQIQQRCRRSVLEMTPVNAKMAQPLLEIKKRLLDFLNTNPDNMDAMRFMYYTECYLLNFRKAKEYLEKVCEHSQDRKDKTNLFALNEIVDKLSELALDVSQLSQLVDYVVAHLKEQQVCDHTLKFTRQWLRENVKKKSHDKVIKWLQNNGGYCDCEVTCNVMSR
jgi:hypothetical protein